MADFVVVVVVEVLPPPQPLKQKMMEEKNSPMAARVMDVPWRGNLLN
jgi:hypothetical protein